jgi:hypothetical protein
MKHLYISILLIIRVARGLVTYPSSKSIGVMFLSPTAKAAMNVDGASTLPTFSTKNVSYSCHDTNSIEQRRSFLLNAFLSATTVGVTFLAAKESCYAEDVIWLSGKSPKVPGQTPNDKNDLKGTRKDPNFLRSIADCKNQCENTPGAGGGFKEKELCLQECQDICCTSYEQCTFAIIPRI